ncbi:hypothetical protein AURDEDRAFT_69865 [Auricularia subglabra TFB-10046 SS5]|nr:hypothetical protein AURDEDRAFT_69865 [Auricularia subglabra TFB-10046 SS5]
MRFLRQGRRSCSLRDASPGWVRRFGERNQELVIAYEGSGDRVRRVLAKAARGEPLNYGIIGGSLSRGHGCHCATFHQQIFDWLNSTYPHPDNVYTDGSVGARGSNYFKFCHPEHIKEDIDLLVLELSINDDPIEAHARNLESILRAVLEYPRKPAVVLTASFSLMGRMAMGNDVHLSVAQYYDVPVINIRHALLPIIQKNPDAVHDFFVIKNPTPGYIDMLHLNALGHHILAQATIAFLERQKCLMETGLERVPANDTAFVGGISSDDALPRVRSNADWSSTETARIDRPSCASVDSVEHPLKPLGTSHGWALWNQPRTTKTFWRATEPGAQIDFEVQLTEGSVMLYYLKSRKMNLGTVLCWLDDLENEKVHIEGWWNDPRSVGQFKSISEGKKVSPGGHVLHCRLAPRGAGKEPGRGTEFLIIAVFSI